MCRLLLFHIIMWSTNFFSHVKLGYPLCYIKIASYVSFYIFNRKHFKTFISCIFIFVLIQYNYSVNNIQWIKRYSIKSKEGNTFFVLLLFCYYESHSFLFFLILQLIKTSNAYKYRISQFFLYEYDAMVFNNPSNFLYSKITFFFADVFIMRTLMKQKTMNNDKNGLYL